MCYGAPPARAKALIGICSLVAALYFPFGQAYGSPNFNTLLALHSTNMEESTEILTIFPWYSYVVGLFIFALGVIAIRRQPGEKNHGQDRHTLSGVQHCRGVCRPHPEHSLGR